MWRLRSEQAVWSPVAITVWLVLKLSGVVIKGIPKRVFSLFWAIFFLLGTAGEGFGLHPCPYHDTLHEVGADTEASDADHGHHGHAANSDGAGSADHNGGSHAEGELCTHTEACPTPSVALLPVEVELTTVATLAAADEDAPAPVERTYVAYIPFFLPYSHGPPANG